MNDLQRASARVMLCALTDHPEVTFNLADVRRQLGGDVADKVKERADEYRQFNRDMKAGGGDLSPDAAGFWTDTKKMLAFGNRVHADGWRGAAATKLTRMCERLEESFEARVPDVEKGKFIVYDPKRMDGGNWDERWHACRDWKPPLLREELIEGKPLANPRRQALIEVLTGIVEPPAITDPGTSSRGAVLRAMVRRDD